MQKFILAKKKEMTQFFDENGHARPATVLIAGPVKVVQTKRADGPDGYNAVQFGFGAQKLGRVSKAVRGHIKKAAGKDEAFQHLREFRVEKQPEHKSGDALSVVDVFSPGDTVMVSGISKGKGFQGVVKRHGFHGGPRSHGQKHSEREPGSIGATGPQRVFKGTKMAGRMGGERVTVKGLKVLAVDAEKNEMIVSGAVPGRRGTLLEMKSV